MAPFLTGPNKSEQATLSREIADIQERLTIEQEKAARAGVSAKDASKAFNEWMSKYSLAAGRRIHRHPTQVSEEAKAEARDRLKTTLRDLVQAIECGPETNEVAIFFRHDPDNIGVGFLFGVESAFRPLLKA